MLQGALIWVVLLGAGATIAGLNKSIIKLHAANPHAIIALCSHFTLKLHNSSQGQTHHCTVIVLYAVTSYYILFIFATQYSYCVDTLSVTSLLSS